MNIVKHFNSSALAYMGAGMIALIPLSGALGILRDANLIESLLLIALVAGPGVGLLVAASNKRLEEKRRERLFKGSFNV